MPSIAILSDIHANLPALQAVLEEADQCGAERIVFLGDIVGYGGSPVPCVDLVRRMGSGCVMGNHDIEIQPIRKRGCSFRDPGWQESEYLAGLAHAAKCLDPYQAEWLAALPFRMTLPGAIAAHGSLDEPEAFYPIHDHDSARRTLTMLGQETSKVGFFGHTHEQRIFTDDAESLEWLDETRVRIRSGSACAVTVGAVGRPDDDPEKRASWVLWDPERGILDFRRTDYDRLQAADDVIAAGLPVQSALALLTASEAISFHDHNKTNQRTGGLNEQVRNNVRMVHRQLDHDLRHGDPKATAMFRMLQGELKAARKSLGL